MTQPPAYPPPPDQPPGQPPDPSAPTAAQGPRTRRGMTIAAIALAAVLVLAVGALGAWLLLRDADRDGPAEPDAAVDAFLRAVYQDHDASEASALVCAEARDEGALVAKIESIEEFASGYEGPRFNWDEPELVEETDDLAIMSVTITMLTTDERSTDQNLRVSVLDKDEHGWWVCNIESEEPGDPEESDESDDPEEADEPDEPDGDDE